MFSSNIQVCIENLFFFFDKINIDLIFIDRDSTIKHLLHRVDRAIIYIFISASYTPWYLLNIYIGENSISYFFRLLMRPTQTISTSFTVTIVWIMAILGITYQILYHERYKWLETCFYVIVGVFPAIVIIDMVNSSTEIII
jgi:monocyte-to-macrophage differentiation protein